MRLVKIESYNRIYAVGMFEQEFDNIVNEKNNNSRYHKWLRRKLDVLDIAGYKALSDRDFEPLKDTNPKLYSIRYPKSKKNPRVIYAYVDEEAVYLLHTFKETSKKSKSDYQNAIRIALNRLKSVI